MTKGSPLRLLYCHVDTLALVLKFAGDQWDQGLHEFLPDAKHLSAVDESAFADILHRAAWSTTNLLM